MSWTEERRKDKAAAAEQARRDRQANAEIHLQRRQADNQARLEAMKLRAGEARKDRAERRRNRAAFLQRLRGWLLEEGPAAVVMGAPMLLAWTAMAAYGQDVYGDAVGWIMPLFTEAAMIWFALAVRRALKENRPVGWLRVGLVVSAAWGAAMNYLHGATGESGSWDRGVVMAVVSVGGVTVHQMITAGPRATRSRADRVRARTARQAQRRAAAIQRVAVRQAHAELAADGTVRLVYLPGHVTLERRGLLRRRRVTEVPPTAMPATSEPAAITSTEPVQDPVVPNAEQNGSELADEVEAWLAAQIAPGGSHLAGPAETPGTTTDSTPDTPTGSRTTGNHQRNHSGNQHRNHSGNQGTGSSGTTDRELIERAKTAIQAGELPARPSKRKVQAVLQIRAVVAGRIAKALKNDDGGGDSTPSGV